VDELQWKIIVKAESKRYERAALEPGCEPKAGEKFSPIDAGGYTADNSPRGFFSG